MNKNKEVVCPHCGAHVDATFDFCSKCSRGLGESWQPDETYLTEKNKVASEKAKLRSIAAVLGAIAIFVVSVFIKIGFDEKHSLDLEQAQAAAQQRIENSKFGGHCSGITYELDETVAKIIDAGVAYTAQDVQDVLSKNAKSLTVYSDLSNKPWQSLLLRKTASQMLILREELIYGRDSSQTSVALKMNFDKIVSVCSE